MSHNTRVNRIVSQLNVETPINSLYSNSTLSTLQYKYTVSNNTITVEQRDFYEKNGYLLIRNVVPQSDLDKYKQHFIDIANGAIERSMGMTVMRDIALAKQKNIKGIGQ